jgi:MFS family permease
VLEWSQHPDNPFNWLLWQKWATMSVACWVTFIVGLNATSITTASSAISSEFHLSSSVLEVSFFSSTAWNAAAAIGPLVTLPLMDTYGVRAGYVVCLTLSVPIFPCAYTLDLLYSVLHLSGAAGSGQELCNPCRLSCICWRVWRHLAERG